MGIGIVVAMWAVAGVVGASVGAVGGGCATAVATRGVGGGRWRAVVAACVFPFVCLAWAGAVFVFQAVVNEGLLQRDLGVGDTWHAPLPNGYQVVMIDVTDQGDVYRPNARQPDGGMVGTDGVFGVRLLQVTRRHILGAVDSPVDGYFVLDTVRGRRVDFTDRGSFEQRVSGLGIELKLEPIYAVYSRFRFSWFDVFAGGLMLVPPVVGGCLLVAWVVRLRGRRGRTPLLVI